ncbi:CCA tRNA nucleotidyltransferase [Candidatus Micrarchaeota archaeon]|nr:CCA tRNA nucleotidyltransferase [Candidatus Micrarchaeota archaeon]
MGFPKIKKKVLKQIKPSKKDVEGDMEIAGRIKDKLSEVLPPEFRISFTGSISKGTYLKDSKDIDVFVLVPKTVDKKELKKIVEKAVKKAFPKSRREIKYAEHPYVRLYVYGRKIDVVPAYNITYIEERASAVDRSVLHTGYVREKITEKNRDDVLLLKQFLKVHDLYGAEIRVQGFSGYLCELLIIHYGGFDNLLKAASGWEFPVVIDIEKYYKRDEEIARKFSTQNITVVDPVDPNRDVSAVVSDEVINRFILLSRLFLKKPSESFFKNIKMSPKRKKLFLKRHANLFFLSFPRPDLVDDILWGELRRFGKQMVKYLQERDFTVLDYYMRDTGENIIMLVETLEKELPPRIPVLGPAIFREKNLDNFRKAHKDAVLYLNGIRMVALEERKITSIEQAVKEFVKGKTIPKDLRKPVKRYKLTQKIDHKTLEEYLFWREIFRRQN